ncbi:hypothetical protein LINPERPRIM_LOCUS25617 [Linum perenne]
MQGFRRRPRNWSLCRTSYRCC